MHEGAALYFRGEPRCGWEMRPSVMRGGFSEYESEMLRDVMSRRPQEFGGTPSALAQWVLAQHHLLKTRFLDVIKNPLVALFFACEDDKFQHDDGRLHVIAVSPLLVKPFTSDAVSVVSNFAKLTPDEQRFLLGKGGQPPRFPNAWLHYHEAMERLCQLIQSEKPYFANRIDVRDFFKVFVVEPQHSPERIRAQSGAFLVSAFHERFERGEVLNWNRKIPVYSHYELTIPCRRKTALLGDLERLNITRENPLSGPGRIRQGCHFTLFVKTGIAVHQLAGHDGREQHLFGAANQVGHPAVSLHQQRIGVGIRYNSCCQSALYKLRRLVENGFLEVQAVAWDRYPLCLERALCLAVCQLRVVMIRSTLF